MNRSNSAVMTVALVLALIVSACGEDRVVSGADATSDASASDAVTLTLSVGSASADEASEVVRRRLASLGIDGSSVETTTDGIAVRVPPEDEELVRQALQIPGELEFRPVLATLGQSPTGQERATVTARVEELRGLLGVPPGVTAADVFDEEKRSAQSPEPGAAPPNRWKVDTATPEFAELYQLESQLAAQITPVEERTDDGAVTLATEDGAVYELGQVALDGRALERATAGESNGMWTVDPVFRAGKDGIDRFNAIAGACYRGEPSCPASTPDDTSALRGQLAIVLDGVILSAPSINTPRFERDQISISGSFDEESARALAAALDAGAPATWSLPD